MSERISVSVSEKANVSGAAGNSSGCIYGVGRSSGGVGQSMMTLATVDHSLEQGANGAARGMRTRRTAGSTSSTPCDLRREDSW